MIPCFSSTIYSVKVYNDTLLFSQRNVVMPQSIMYLVSYQREVDKGKLTAVASFEKLTFRA